MISERECYVYIVLPGATEFITAGRFRVSPTPEGEPVGQFVYGRRYLERRDAVELDPVELRLRRGVYETARMGFSARSAIPCRIIGGGGSSKETPVTRSSKNSIT
ncbi:MAG: hypothetical protein WAU34_09980 [Desulfobacterales bacterium]